MTDIGIIHHNPARKQPMQFRTVDDILKQACPVCGHIFYVTNYHIGGLGNVPHVCCSNPDGGHAHVKARISDRLAWEYRDFIWANERLYSLFPDEVA